MLEVILIFADRAHMRINPARFAELPGVLALEQAEPRPRNSQRTIRAIYVERSTQHKICENMML